MKKILIIIPFILTLLTGCYNYEELNNLAIVSAISISLNKNNQYDVIVQVVNPKKEQDSSSSNEPDFITFESTGSTLHESFRKLTKKSLKRIYGNQMQVVIIDESIAKNNLKDILDFLIREPEIRNEVYILIGKDKDILKILTPLNNISSQNIKESIENDTKRLGCSKIITLSDLIKDYKNPNIELTIPSIKISGNSNDGKEEKNLEQSQTDTSIELDGIAVFKDNKLKGYLTDDESLTYNFITNKIKNTLIKLNYNNNNEYIITETISSKTKLIPNIKNNTITINIKGTSAITELNKKIDIEKKENINKLEKKLNNKIEKFITINYQRINDKYNSDIYGFKDLYYKTNNKYYKRMNNKENILKNIKIKVKVDIKIIEQGNLLGGIDNE